MDFKDRAMHKIKEKVRHATTDGLTHDTIEEAEQHQVVIEVAKLVEGVGPHWNNGEVIAFIFANAETLCYHLADYLNIDIDQLEKGN